MSDPWTILGLAPTSDRMAVRRAYARRLKLIDLERNPAGFQELREAYEEALAGTSDRRSRSAPRSPAPAPAPAPPPPPPPPPPTAAASFTPVPEAPSAPTVEPPSPPAPAPPTRPADPPIAVVVADWMSRIRGAAVDGGEDAAIAALDELQNSGALTRLDLRERLEEDLLHWLARPGSVQWKVLAKARDLFDWRHDAKHLRDLLGPEERKRIVWRLEDLDAFERLRRQAAEGDKTAQVLTGPYQPLRFFGIGLLEKRFLPIAEEVVRLRDLHPWVLDPLLDTKVAEWWKKRCERPRIYLRDVWFWLILVWLFAPASESPLFTTVGLFVLVVACSFGLQIWKARKRLAKKRHGLHFLFWPLWLLVLPLEMPFVLLLLPAIYFFVYSLGFLRGAMGRGWYWSIVPAWLFAASLLRPGSPWNEVSVWAPGLVFLVGFGCAAGHNIQLPSFISWGWMPTAGLLAAAAVFGQPSEALAFGLLVTVVWALVVAAWGRRGALWQLSLLGSPFVAAANGWMPAGLPGGTQPLIHAELATRVDYSALLLAVVAIYIVVRLATQAAASRSER